MLFYFCRPTCPSKSCLELCSRWTHTWRMEFWLPWRQGTRRKGTFSSCLHSSFWWIPLGMFLEEMGLSGWGSWSRCCKFNSRGNLIFLHLPEMFRYLYVYVPVRRESLQSHMILTMSHWFSGLPVCFPPQGTQVQIPWGDLCETGILLLALSGYTTVKTSTKFKNCFCNQLQN